MYNNYHLYLGALSEKCECVCPVLYIFTKEQCSLLKDTSDF